MYRGSNNSGNNENCYSNPILQKWDKNQHENYRPISLLTPMSKIFEKLFMKKMSTFVTKHKILSPNQFDFKKNTTAQMQSLKQLIIYDKKLINKIEVIFA